MAKKKDFKSSAASVFFESNGSAQEHAHDVAPLHMQDDAQQVKQEDAHEVTQEDASLLVYEAAYEDAQQEKQEGAHDAAQEDTLLIKQEAVQEHAQEVAYDDTHDVPASAGAYFFASDAQEAVQHQVQQSEPLRPIRTQGRRGKKKPRINMAFEPEIYAYIQSQSELEDMSMTQWVNEVVYQHMKNQKN